MNAFRTVVLLLLSIQAASSAERRLRSASSANFVSGDDDKDDDNHAGGAGKGTTQKDFTFKTVLTPTKPANQLPKEDCMVSAWGYVPSVVSVH
jgi:hypothetical protein